MNNNYWIIRWCLNGPDWWILLVFLIMVKRRIFFWYFCKFWRKLNGSPCIKMGMRQFAMQPRKYFSNWTKVYASRVNYCVWTYSRGTNDQQKVLWNIARSMDVGQAISIPGIAVTRNNEHFVQRTTSKYAEIAKTTCSSLGKPSLDNYPWFNFFFLCPMLFVSIWKNMKIFT